MLARSASRAHTTQMKGTTSGVEFEAIIRDILIANGFVMGAAHAPASDEDFDFLATLGDDQWCIEAKFYRTDRAQVKLIESAAARLRRAAKATGSRRGMLIVSSFIGPELRLALEPRFGVTFVDRNDLFIWAARSPELLDRLTSVLEASKPTVAAVGGRDVTAASIPPAPPPQPIVEPAADTQGSQLLQELAGLQPGKTTWSEYENLCTRVLKYLFPDDLHGWHEQSWTDDGLNRFDYVCRIRPTRDFWKFLLEHLHSRYVLFEFKNYTGAIKQGQVLTTEKYLLERGLRRVAIIFTRAGADANAVKTTQGAMREQGKLILILDDEAVSTMLLMKERGEDPSDFLFELADQFLLSLPR